MGCDRRSSSERNTARLVWYLMGLSVSAGLLTLGAISWTLREMERTRTELDARDTEISFLLRDFTQRTQYGESVVERGLAQGADLPRPADWFARCRVVLDRLETLAAPYSDEPGLGELGDDLAALRDLWGEVHDWVHRFNDCQASLASARQTQLVQLQQVRESVANLSGAERLRQAARYRSLEALPPEDAIREANRIIEAIGPRSGLEAASRELATVALLCERLYTTRDADTLSDLRDNQFFPALSRLRRLVSATSHLNEAELGDFSRELSDLEFAIFGQERVLDRAHQTIHPGNDGLFALVTERLALERTRAELRAALATLLDGLVTRRQALTGLANAGHRASTVQFERAVRNSRNTAILVVVVITLVFAVLGRRIASTVRGHVATIEEKSTQLEAEARERRLAEVSLRDSEARLRTILESVQTGLMVIDAETHEILDVNPVAARLLGRSPEEIIGRSCNQFVCTTEVGRCPVTDLGQVIDSSERELLRDNGESVPVLKTVVPLTLSGRRCLLECFVDLSERKHMEEALREAKEAAEEAAHTKSQFLANMSHEIRTPMNGVIGMTDMLFETGLNEEQRSYLETIRASGEALLHIINDILDFSKIEAGKLEVEEIAFDLRGMVEEALEILAPRAEAARLELTHESDPNLPDYVMGDPGRIRQVLLNLAGNAIKFTREGEVTVQAVCVSGDTDRHVIKFSVTDTGIGIAQDRLEALFEAFTQADASTTRQYGGTGLGLAISRQLVNLMGGEIGVDSEEGRGSTFWFTVSLGRTNASAQASTAIPAILQDKRVLVVDDSGTNLRIVVQHLERWGCLTDSAADASDALTLLRVAADCGAPYDAAIIDMAMPDKGGAELGRRILADVPHEDTRVLLLTSLTERVRAKRLVGEGFSGYLVKPVRPRLLQDALVAMLAAPAGQPIPLVTRQSAGLSDEQEIRQHGQYRILVAEDNPTNQTVALSLLRKRGYQAEAVANGQEALDALETGAYDLVLMDCQMPIMDGYEATRAFRAREGQGEHLPVVAMTANVLKGDREKCLEAGMDDYVAKPIRSAWLESVLSTYLGGGSSHSGTPSEPAGQPSLAVFDYEGALERLGNDKELLAIVLSAFEEDVPRQLALIQEAVEGGDTEALSRHGHALKGSAASIGAEQLSEWGRCIEKEGATASPDRGRFLLEHAREAYAAFKAAAANRSGAVE